MRGESRGQVRSKDPKMELDLSFKHAEVGRPEERQRSRRAAGTHPAPAEKHPGSDCAGYMRTLAGFQVPSLKSVLHNCLPEPPVALDWSSLEKQRQMALGMSWCRLAAGRVD